jgi:hypothetical protein
MASGQRLGNSTHLPYESAMYVCTRGYLLMTHIPNSLLLAAAFSRVVLPTRKDFHEREAELAVMISVKELELATFPCIFKPVTDQVFSL